jgi:hypothetical protein
MGRTMSLYQTQKFLYLLNRDPRLQAAYHADRSAAIADFDLTDEERTALTRPDIGLLFHLGVNGQILMHFGALHGIEWSNYLQLMRDGIATHGPVREGVYAMTGYEGTDAHAARLGHATTAAHSDRGSR